MKTLLFELLYRTGLVRLASWWNRKQVMILCYHGVTERSERSPDDPHGLHVRLPRLAKQLDYLKRRCHVISLTEFLDARRSGKPLPANSTILTFDDGFRNFLTAAIAELRERNFQATMFLINDRVRENGSGEASAKWTPADDETYLSWPEVRRLSSGGTIQFGSHTCSHRKLATLNADESQQELESSRAEISSQLNLSEMPLAYPFGDYSVVVTDQARALGYTCALTTEDGGNETSTDLYTLRRTLIGDNDDEAAFAVRVSGLISA